MCRELENTHAWSCAVTKDHRQKRGAYVWRTRGVCAALVHGVEHA